MKDDGDKYEVSEPVEVGGMPPRPELTVLPGGNDPTKELGTLGWSCYPVTGTDTYRPGSGDTWPPTCFEDCEKVARPENLVTTEDGLVEGEELLVQDLMGLHVATVHFHGEDGEPYGLSSSGNTMFMLDFVDDRPDGEPPRWVCVGSANLAGLRRLKFLQPEETD